MKKAEKILVFLLMASMFLVYIRMPLGKMFFTILGLIMSIYYLFGSVFLLNDIKIREVFCRSAYSGLSLKEIFISIWAGYSLSSLIGALLFLVNEWPIYATQIVVLSAFLSMLFSVGLCVVLLNPRTHVAYKRILRRTLSGTIFLVLVILLSIGRYANWI